MIYVLEDNSDRVHRMKRAAAAAVPDVQMRFWRSAHAMTHDLVDALEHAALISLDHDLIPEHRSAADPGCGYDIARLLAQLIPVCPIIVHTSNSERGNWMTVELRRSGWVVDRVYPDEGDWIEMAWASAVRRHLANQ